MKNNDGITLSTYSGQELLELMRKAYKQQEFSFQTPPAENEDADLLNKEEAAKLLKVSISTLNEWVKLGKVPAYRIGTRIRFKKFEIIDSLKKIKSIQSNQKGGSHD